MRKTAGLATLAALALSAAAATSLGATAGAAPSGGPGADALAALTAHPGAARAADGQEFVVRRTVTDADGTTHVRMDRTYDGLRVVGGDLVVHQAKDDRLEGVSQTLRAPLTLSSKASLTASTAVARATSPTRTNRLISGDKEAKKTELVVDATGAKPRLAWEVVTGGMQHDGTPSRLATYVDARTGAVIRTDQQIVNVDGTGQSLYSGTVPLNLTQSGSSYQLKDASRGGTYTTDLNNATDSIFCQILQIGCQAGTTFSSPDTSFGNGSTSSRESAGVDAQYGTDVTWDFYQNVYGRNGIFGDGRGSYNRTHYGQNYVNAFWNGTYMTYGDGDGVDFGPLVSLDVAGHEMTHGVTENTAGLTYSGESGGLNEATSDIFGTMVEFYADNSNDPGDYLIGEEFDLKEPPRLPPDGQPVGRRQLAQLLERRRGRRRRPLLLRHRQPLLLPAVGGLGSPRRSAASRTTRRRATARASRASARRPPGRSGSARWTST